MLRNMRDRNELADELSANLQINSQTGPQPDRMAMLFCFPDSSKYLVKRKKVFEDFTS